MNAEATARSAAKSRSASSQTTNGFLPPSSRHTFASTDRSLTIFWINLPVADEPVKLTTPTRLSWTNGAPASGPEPCTAE